MCHLARKQLDIFSIDSFFLINLNFTIINIILAIKKMAHKDLEKKNQEWLRSLTEDNRTALKKQFAEFDKNKDGKISVKEWMAVMRSDGLPHLSESELQAFISQFDADHNGTLDFNEFLSYCQ